MQESTFLTSTIDDPDMHDLRNHILRNTGLGSFLYQLKYVAFAIHDFILKLIFLVNIHIFIKM